ncbi:MAG: hypothetical protein AABZ64_04270 [Nitrospinota bacterium]
MAESILLEVDENDNCPRMPAMVYEALGEPAPVSRVRLAEPGRPHGLYRITGWSSAGGGTPCPALYVPVSDSGAGAVHLVYGGDWGVRLKPLDSEEGWDLRSPRQFGEPYLMLFDRGDVGEGEV